MANPAPVTYRARVEFLVEHGGEWWLGGESHLSAMLIREGMQFALDPVKRSARRDIATGWNGVVSRGVSAVGMPRWRNPCWLPIAWLCLTTGKADGYGFARAILQAEDTDDTPALIAADWFEENGYEGRCDYHLDPGRSIGEQLRGQLRGSPPDWEIEYTTTRSRGPLNWGVGPIAAWCRHLVYNYCLTCGGRKDGCDPYRFGSFTIAERRNYDKETGYPKHITLRCPRCGHVQHNTMPRLAIPEIVEAGGY